MEHRAACRLVAAGIIVTALATPLSASAASRTAVAAKYEQRHSNPEQTWISPLAMHEMATRGLMFVSDLNAHVLLYPLHNAKQPIGSMGYEMNAPQRLAVDGRTRELYVAMVGDSTVRAYRYPYTGRPVRTYSQDLAFSVIFSVGVGPDSTVYIAALNEGSYGDEYAQVLVFPPNSTVASQIISVPNQPGCGIWQLGSFTFDNTGTAYVPYARPPSCGPNGVLTIAPHASSYSFVLQSPYVESGPMAFDLSGNLVIGGAVGTSIGLEIWPPGASAPSTILPVPGSVSQIAFDHAGKSMYEAYEVCYGSSNPCVASVNEVAYPSNTVLNTVGIGNLVGGVAVLPPAPFPSPW